MEDVSDTAQSHDGQIKVEWEFADGQRHAKRVAGSLAAWELKQELLRRLDDESQDGLSIWFNGVEVYCWQFGMDVGSEVRPLDVYSFGPKDMDESK